MFVVALTGIEEIRIGRIHPPRIRAVVVEFLQVFPIDGAGLGMEGVIDLHARRIIAHRWPDMRDTALRPRFEEFMGSSRVEKVWLSMPYLLDRLNLKGAFQKKNAMVALASVMALKYKGYLKKVSFTSIEKGFKTVIWPGRYETLLKKPLVIADGGHNVQCTKALIESLDEEDIKKAIFVIGIMADKDYKEVFKLLTPYIEQVIATEPSNPRRLDAEDICE